MTWLIPLEKTPAYLHSSQTPKSERKVHTYMYMRTRKHIMNYIHETYPCDNLRTRMRAYRSNNVH